jgi:sugar phosphate isomerase/epimerase
MKTGFITNSLADQMAGGVNLALIADWAEAQGFDALEIGPSIPIDEKTFDAVLSRGKLSFSAFIYCRNFLSEKAEEAENFRAKLLERIRSAKKFGIEKVICSTGVTGASFSREHPAGYHGEASLDAVAELFKGFAEEAERNEVKLCFENCPLMGNIATAPWLWDLLFEKIGSNRVGLVYDPSHLVWQFIEPYDLILQYRDRIFHVHGKDCEVDLQSLKRTGVLQHFSRERDSFNAPHGNQTSLWWRYRLPGLGDLNWSKIVSRLYEIGYTGVISIEHEDPVWSGSEEKVKAGLLLAKKHIGQYL